MEMPAAVGNRPASNWLDAHSDSSAGVHTFSQCMALADLNNDGDCRLIVADHGHNFANMKLRNPLLDLPVALAAFHMDLTQPRIPAIAVASGPHIYIYKNLRPYFKFSLPPLEVSAVERDVWAQTVMTCMTTLKKSLPDEDAVSCLVLGTESGHVYILDSEAFTILDTIRVSGIPALLAATGLRDVEFRVVVCCRDREVALIKRGWKDARRLLQLPSQAVAIALHPQGSIVAVLMDNTLRGYTRKGKETWCVSLASSARCMVGIPLPQHGTWVAGVGLANGQVLLYMDGHLVDMVANHSPVSALVSGTFGRGEHCLIINTADGALLVKILRRTATFNPLPESTDDSATQQLQVPKKTKLFVEQTMRERDNSKSMHEAFQHDLLRLRLRTARACAASLRGDSNPVALGTQQPLRLSAQVRGLGPTFQIRIKLENMSENESVIGLAVVFHFDTKLYSVSKPFVQVPMLVHAVPFETDTLIRYVSATPGLSGVVRALVVQGRMHQAPLLAALIHMPCPDPTEFDLI
ncbi:hypothetical protein B566_EDAN006362 [Ephemera danica]|nr:hypothetical protein B566_EDAN006362 [Ephemera danica]